MKKGGRGIWGSPNTSKLPREGREVEQSSIIHRTVETVVWRAPMVEERDVLALYIHSDAPTYSQQMKCRRLLPSPTLAVSSDVIGARPEFS